MIRGATARMRAVIPAASQRHRRRPSSRATSAADEDALAQEVTLLELLDRVLDKGVVLSGDITLSVADVDLVYVGLRVLLSSVDAADAPAVARANPNRGCREQWRRAAANGAIAAMIYVYAVAEVPRRIAAVAGRVRGLDGAPVELRTSGGDVAAACSSHRRQLRPADAQNVWLHERVVEVADG